MYTIREKREAAGMTQERLAEKSGISRATIVALESEESSISTTTSTLTKLASALGCSIGDLLAPND